MRSRTGQPAVLGDRAFRAPVVAAGCLLLLASGCASRVAQNAGGAPYRRTGWDAKSTAALEEFRKSVGPFLRKENIPGCAFALVDEQGLLWAEGFGEVGRPKRTPVTPDTVFRVLSVSKVVGTAAYYSNGGIDLAAYILQVVSGTPFPEYVRQHLLLPMSMTNGLLTPPRGPMLAQRAVGHTLGVIATLHPGPMTGAAGPVFPASSTGIRNTASAVSRWPTDIRRRSSRPSPCASPSG